MDTQHSLTNLLQLRVAIRNSMDAVWGLNKVVHLAIQSICYTCGREMPNTLDRNMHQDYGGYPYSLCAKCHKKVKRGQLKVLPKV